MIVPHALPTSCSSCSWTELAVGDDELPPLIVVHRISHFAFVTPFFSVLFLHLEFFLCSALFSIIPAACLPAALLRHVVRHLFGMPFFVTPHQ